MTVLEAETAMCDMCLDQIDPDPDQPRKHFNEELVTELAQSMKADGLAVPILVRPVGERFIIVHGERRYRAAKLLNWQSVPALVRELTADQAFQVSLIENIQRLSLSAIEEAHAFRRLSDGGLSQAKIGKLIGKSQQFVADRLSLLKLTAPVQELVTARAVNPSIARRLIGVEDAKEQFRLARKAANDKITVRKIENELKYWRMREDTQCRIRQYHAEKILSSTTLNEDRRKRYAKAAMDGDQAVFHELVKDEPELAVYTEAVEKDELEIQISYLDISDPDDRFLTLRIPTLRREFSGQTWRWPKYSGEALIQPKTEEIGSDGWDGWYENFNVPLFTTEEWDEWLKVDARKELAELEFPGRDWFEWWLIAEQAPRNPALNCRDYDPQYGRFIGQYQSVPAVSYENVFVKRGWGQWRVIEFNDGDAGRIRRRFFEQAHTCKSLIQQVGETIDPHFFSDQNFQRMHAWKVQPFEASWAYIRRKTIPREEMIAALERDIADLRNAKPLSDDEFAEKLLDWLQEYLPAEPWYEWREGEAGYARRPDGTVDEDLMEERFDMTPMPCAAG